MMRNIFRADSHDLALILLAVAFTRLISIYCFSLYDDAFITFRYAANLVHGNGFVYNVGEHVQGTTAPLWGLILAVPDNLGWGIETAARVLGLLLELATAAVVYFALKRENLTRAALLSGFLFALDLYLAKISVSGMESTLLLLGTLSASALALKGHRSAAAIISGLCVFLRPEALLFALCLIAFLWVEDKRFPLKPVLLGVAVILVGVTAQFWYYGDLIPQSVRGKMALQSTYSDLWNLVLFPRKDPLQCLLSITALLSVPVAWRVSRFARLQMVWACVLFASWAITGTHLWMWYMVPVYFTKVLLTGIGMDRLLSHVTLREKMLRWLQPRRLCGGTILVWCVLALVAGPDRIERNIYSRMRNWCGNQDLQGQRTYGMDFGAFGYYSGMPVLDEPGLVYPPSLSLYHTDPEAILLAERPEWAFVTCYDHNIEMMRSTRLALLYEPVIRFSEDGDTLTRPDLKSVSPIWKRDFILFKRRDVFVTPMVEQAEF